MSRVDGLRWDSWPDPATLDLLTALLHRDHEVALRSWQRFRAGWDPDVSTGDQFRLIPLIADRGALLDPDEPFLGRARGVRRMLTVRMLFLLDELDTVLTTLAEAGIDGVVLKGPALLLSVYDHVGQRFSGDLDVLIRPSQIEPATRALVVNGWTSLDDDTLGTHAVGFRRGDIALDLHRQPNREMVVPEHLEETLSYLETEVAERPLRSGRRIRVLVPTDALVHTLVHGSQCFLPINSRWVVDADRLIATGRIDWDRVVSLARLFRVSPVVHDALVLVERVTGVPTPPTVLRVLERDRIRLVDRLWLQAYHAAPSYSRSQPGMPYRLVRMLIAHRNRTALGMLREAPDYFVRDWGLRSRWQLPGAVLRRVGNVRLRP